MDEPVENQICSDCGTPAQFGHATGCAQHPRIIEKNARYAGRPEVERTHRFEVSRDPALREKIHIYRDGLRALQAEYPEVVGATVFGSSVKALATDESDVDSILFVDPAKAAERSPSIQVTHELREDKKGAKSIESHFEDDIEALYGAELSLIVNQPPHSGERSIVEHALALPMSEEIINVQLEAYLKFIGEQIPYEYSQMMNRVEEGKGEKSADDSKPPTAVWIGANIDGLFHLQVGHGLDKYRRYLIKQLRNNKYGEPAWRGIMRCVENGEEWQPWSGQRFPRMLCEAEKVYGDREKIEGKPLEDKYDLAADTALSTFLRAMIEDDVFRGRIFITGMDGYHQRLREMADRRGGPDQIAWAEYWATKGFVDLARLYPGFTIVEEGVAPSIHDLELAIQNLPDEVLRDKWRQKTDQLNHSTYQFIPQEPKD